jgi:hypothetical protein
MAFFLRQGSSPRHGADSGDRVWNPFNFGAALSRLWGAMLSTGKLPSSLPATALEQRRLPRASPIALQHRSALGALGAVTWEGLAGASLCVLLLFGLYLSHEYDGYTLKLYRHDPKNSNTCVTTV